MKKYILVITALLCSVFALSAQGRQKPDKEMFKEIQEYKMKYLAQEMELKEDQKEKFIELYQQMSDERHSNFQQMRRLEKSLKDDASEEEYKKATEGIADLKVKDAQIEKEYDAKFAKFLTQKQIYKMKEAEEKFRKKMHEMRQKRCGKKK